MQVVCANCQLSFQAPEGAAGLLCPICRSPLRPPEAATGGPPTPSARQLLDWAGGTLDDLVALLSGPSWSARIEVLTPGQDEPAGEVHVIAGGVADAIYAGVSSHDSLDNLRGVVAKGTHFRVEPRLPNPADGNLTTPGPEQGKLEDRPLATLMRYCEDFVLTCGIEVWRGSENAKVEYRRGEIVGVTVGGIDAPERLAEVMKWASGSYRIVVPKLTLPATAPARAPAAPAPVVPRVTGAASRTIFGMPAVDLATLVAAKAKAEQSSVAGHAPSAPLGAAASGPVSTSAPTPVASASASSTLSAPTASPPAVPRSSGQASVVNPGRAPASSLGVPTPAASAATASAAPAVATDSSGPSTGAVPPPRVPSSTPPSRPNPNRTIFGVAASAIPAPAREPVVRPAEPPTPAPGQAPTILQGNTVESPAGPAVTKPGPTSKVPRPAAQPSQAVVPAAAAPGAIAARDDDRTSPTRTTGAKAPAAAETAVWTYVGVGFVFGLALLGVYRLVMVFAH